MKKVTKKSIIESISFSKEMYNIAIKKDYKNYYKFDDFISNIKNAVEDNNGTIEDAILIANNEYNNLLMEV